MACASTRRVLSAQLRAHAELGESQSFVMSAAKTASAQQVAGCRSCRCRALRRHLHPVFRDFMSTRCSGSPSTSQVRAERGLSVVCHIHANCKLKHECSGWPSTSQERADCDPAIFSPMQVASSITAAPYEIVLYAAFRCIRQFALLYQERCTCGSCALCLCRSLSDGASRCVVCSSAQCYP